MIQLPRLLDKQFHEVARLHPTRLSATDKIDPTSTATMGLPYDEPSVGLRDYVEIFDDNGSKGIYRVEGVNTSNGERQTLNLSHGIVTLEDVIMPADANLEGNIRTMLEAVLAQQITHMWVLGDVEAPEDESYTVNAGNAIALQALINIAALIPECAFSYDQSVTPWVLHFRKREQSPSCECRLARNMSNISVSFSTQEMCTRVTSKLLPNGYMDADNVGVWGVISRELPTKDDTTEDGAVKLAVKYLDQYKHPTASIEIEAIDLAEHTGESLDSLTLGRLCRVALPDWGVTYNHQIVSVYWADLIGKPHQKKLSLATRKNRAETALAQAAQAKKQASRNYKHIIETENSVLIQAQKIALLGEEINLRATKAEVEGATTRISNVEIDLNAAKAAIALKADQTEYNDLAKRVSSAEINIDGANAAISLKASQTVVDDLGTRVSAAEIAIDGANSAIALKADRIDLLGYVTADALETEVLSVVNGANIQTLTVTNMNPYYITGVQATFSGGLEAGSVSSDMFFVGGNSVEETSLKMGTLVSANVWGAGNAIDLSHSHKVTVNADGTITLGEVSSTGGNFKIADTKAYKDGVAAATTKGAESLVFYAGGKEGVADLDYGTSLSITATTTRADGTALSKGILVKAPPDNYNNGWNDCIRNANAFSVLINYYSAGETLYDSAGNVAAGPWYKGTPATRYSLPASKP